MYARRQRGRPQNSNASSSTETLTKLRKAHRPAPAARPTASGELHEAPANNDQLALLAFAGADRK